MKPDARPLVGKPVTVKIPCAGLEPGASVTVKVFEPHAMAGDPLETFDATVDEQGGLATAEWTYDHSKHEDEVARAVFLLVAEGAGRTTVSRPIEFVDRFQATIKDAQGAPAANRRVRLHADRGPSVDGKTDGEGKCSMLVPPGHYHVELLETLPEELWVAAPAPDAPPEPEPAAAADDDAKPGPAADADDAPEKSPLKIRLVRRDGSPMAGARYEVHQPDGQVIPGVLDDQGSAEVMVEDPKGCQVSYPDVHGDEWGHA